MGEGNRNRVRKDPITRERIIMAVDRGGRPGTYKQNGPRHPKKGLVFDPSCVFCPGNEEKTPRLSPPDEPRRNPRAESLYWVEREGTTNPNYEWDLRAVPNKYPFLKIENEYVDPERPLDVLVEGMYEEIAAFGGHNLFIDTPNHGDEIATMPIRFLDNLFTAIGAQSQYLASVDHRYRYIYVFKNCGRETGSSLEHPHTQLIALPFIPDPAKKIMYGLEGYAAAHNGCCGYCDIIKQDISDGRRVVALNNDFVAIAPKFSKYTFSVYILPRQHKSLMEDLSAPEIHSLSTLVQEVMARIDSVLEEPHFNFFFRTAPVNSDVTRESDVHYAHVNPHHLRITIRPKQNELAGAEIGGGLFICTVLPEDAAAYLRDGRPLKEQTG